MRFQMVETPDGAWSVFDAVLGAPADYKGQTLVGLTKAEAAMMAERVTARTLSWRPGAPSAQTARLAAANVAAASGPSALASNGA